MEDNELIIDGDGTISGHLSVGSLGVTGDVHIADPETGGQLFYHDTHDPAEAEPFSWPPDGWARFTAVARGEDEEIHERTVRVPFWEVPV